MSETEPKQSDEHMLKATAMLVESAQHDERLAPLAAEAIKLVIADTGALSMLFSSYMQKGSTMQPYTTGFKTPQQKQADLLSQLEALVKA